MEFTIIDGSTYMIVRTGTIKELFRVPETMFNKPIIVQPEPIFVPEYVKSIRTRKTLRERIDERRSKDRMKDSLATVGIFAASFILGIVSALI